MIALIMMMVLEHMTDIDIIWWPKGVLIIIFSLCFEGSLAIIRGSNNDKSRS